MWVTDGAEVNNKLIGWVDSDFGSEPATRKSCRLIDVFECRHYFLEITRTRVSCVDEDPFETEMRLDNETSEEEVRVSYVNPKCMKENPSPYISNDKLSQETGPSPITTST